MGKSSSAKCTASGVIELISNSKFQIPNSKQIFCLTFFVCAFVNLSVRFVTAQTVENLPEQIRFGTDEVKRDALFQIRNLRSETASRIAIPALKDSSEIVRATATFSIIYLPKEESFSLLAPLLQDKSAIVRRETVYALGKIQNPNAVILLIRLFQKDKIIEVKNAAIVALGEIGEVAAIETLTKLFASKPNDDNEFQRRSAARSIGQIAQIFQINKSYTVTPENFLPEQYKTFTLEKYENLSANLPQFRAAVPVLIKVLQNSKESDDTKRESAFALGAIGDTSAIQILRQNLNSPDYYLAEICKESLVKIQNSN